MKIHTPSPFRAGCPTSDELAEVAGGGVVITQGSRVLYDSSQPRRYTQQRESYPPPAPRSQRSPEGMVLSDSRNRLHTLKEPRMGESLDEPGYRVVHRR